MGKKYILGHNFAEEKTYYVRVLEDTWDEIYNPHFATEFNSELEAEEWSRENTTFGEYATGIQKNIAIIAFDKWSKTGMVRRTILQIDKSISRPYNNETPLEILNWHIKNRLASEDLVKYEHYKTWPAISSVYTHISNIEQYHNGDYTAKYLSFSIKTNRDGSFEKFKEELDLILPHITYLDSDYKKLLIFDYHCGSGGNFADLLYKDDTDCLIKTRYYTECKGDINKVFNFLKKERYYE